jgi:hypothetical protein
VGIEEEERNARCERRVIYQREHLGAGRTQSPQQRSGAIYSISALPVLEVAGRSRSMGIEERRDSRYRTAGDNEQAA